MSRGKIQDYLGMTLDYTIRGQVIITMTSYIEDILVAFDKTDSKGDGTKSSTSPNIYLWLTGAAIN